MNAFPVIVRELRAEARSPFTFSLRVAGGVILLGLLTLFWLNSELSPNAGERLFAQLHLALFLAIWFFVPLAAADCLSRERRENTLGLLFLTPLKPLDIVLAKGLVHGLRAVSLWLAVLPVLAVPLLLGGVSWVTALLSVIVNASAICWALTAGLLASALSTRRSRAIACAACLAGGGFFVFAYVTGVSLAGIIPGGWGSYWVERIMRGIWLNAQLTLDWSYFRRVPAGAGRGFTSTALLWVTGKAGILSLLMLVLALLLAARIIRRSWRDKPVSAAWLWFYRVFCTPLFWKKFFARWLRGKLEANPIGWLEQRQWTGRTAIGAWLAIIVSLYLAMLQDVVFYRRMTTEVQTAMAWLLGVSLATTAAGSFRRERELGVLELLLVTPLGARALALGRLRGIWEQFLPAIGLLLGVWIYIAATFGHGSDWPLIVFAATTFLAVPVIGLYFSLKQRGLLGALALTLLFTLFLPVLVPMIGGLPARVWGRGSAPGVLALLWLLAAACQLALAAVCWWRLQLTLRRRAFPMDVQ